MCYMTPPFHLPWFHHLDLWLRVPTTKIFTMQLSPISCNSLPLRFSFYPQQSVCKHCLCSSFIKRARSTVMENNALDYSFVQVSPCIFMVGTRSYECLDTKHTTIPLRTNALSSPPCTDNLMSSHTISVCTNAVQLFQTHNQTQCNEAKCRLSELVDSTDFHTDILILEPSGQQHILHSLRTVLEPLLGCEVRMLWEGGMNHWHLTTWHGYIQHDSWRRVMAPGCLLTRDYREAPSEQMDYKHWTYYMYTEYNNKKESISAGSMCSAASIKCSVFKQYDWFICSCTFHNGAANYVVVYRYSALIITDKLTDTWQKMLMIHFNVLPLNSPQGIWRT